MVRYNLFGYIYVSVFMALIAAFSMGLATVSANAAGLSVSVEVFSGRPNPSFQITDAETIAKLRTNLKSLPAFEGSADSDFEFDRLGYRGVVIFNDAGIEGIPSFVQMLNGKVKIVEKEGSPAVFYKDSNRMERYFLGIAKEKGMLGNLSKNGVPDPDEMPD